MLTFFRYLQVNEDTRIAIKDLVYFEQKDVFDLQTLMCSTTARFGIAKNLCEIRESLDERFFEVKRFNDRRLLINIDHLSVVNAGDRTISLYLSNSSCIVISKDGAPEFLL